MSLKSIALCGVGRMGQIRADCISQNGLFSIKFIVDPISLELRDEMAKKFGAKSASYLKEVIDEVDAVILCTPTKFHAEDITLALQHKKPVFAEKPLAFTKRQTYDVYQLAQQLNVPIFTAYNRRAAKPFKQLKKAVRSEDIHRISFVFRDNPMLSAEFMKTLGDIYEDLSCHEVDLALWYIGMKPTSVFAKGMASFNELGVVDCAAAIFGFPGSKTMICDWSRKSNNGYDERVEVFLKDKNISASIARPDGSNGYSFRDSYWESYLLELVKFQKIVNEFIEKKTFNLKRKYDYCLWVIDVVDALQRSALSGKEEYILPSTQIPLALIGNQNDLHFVKNEVLLGNLWDYFHLTESSSYETLPEAEAFYLSTRSPSYLSTAAGLISEGKSVLFDPIPLSNAQFSTIIKIAHAKKGKLFFNFFLRQDAKLNALQKEIENHQEDLISLLISAQVSSLEEIAHIVDSAVFLSWPFIQANEWKDVKVSPTQVTLSGSLVKADGRTVSARLVIDIVPKAELQLSVKVNETGHTVPIQLKQLQSDSFRDYYQHLLHPKHTSPLSDNQSIYWTFVACGILQKLMPFQ